MGYVEGSRLGAANGEVLSLGSSERAARQALVPSLGEPQVLDHDHHCGEWFPSLDDGSLSFPHGLDVWSSQGRVWRFSMAAENSHRLIWP